MTNRKNSWLSFIAWLTSALFYGYHNAIISLINIASEDLINSLSISTTQFGFITVVYTTGYALMQIPVGILLDHFSLKKLMTTSLLTLSLGCIVLASTPSYYVIIIARILMGIAAAFSVLGSFKIASEWFETRLFATLAGLTVTLGYLGGMNQPLVFLREHYQLSEMFLGLGVIGFILTLSSLIYVRNFYPIERKFQGMKEIVKDLKAVSCNWPSLVLILYAMLIFTPLLVFKDSLGVLFFKSYYGYTAASASTVMDSILIASMVAAPLLGIISDRMGKRKPIIVAAPFMLLACFLCILFRVDLLVAQSHLVVLMLFAAFGFITWGFLLSYSVFKETHDPHILSTGLGLMNSINMFGGILAVPIITSVIDILPIWLPGSTASDHYFYSFMILPIIVLMALPLLRAIPETNCKQQYD